MRNLILMAGAAVALSAGAAQANTIIDPTGDFLPSYTGSKDPDLDVTSFTVDYNASTQDFLLEATLAGPIDPSKVGFYVIGADTGTGTAKPFASIGDPNVIFNQAIVIQKTGAAPLDYGFNLWPRDGNGNNNQISDFAPNNANLSAVPEPSVWATMVAGLIMVGGVMRSRRRASKALTA